MGEVRETATAFAPLADSAKAKLFTHGGSQAVRLPKAFRFEGSEVSIRRSGDAVILEPVRPKRPRTPEEIAAFWKAIDDLGESDLEVPPRGDEPWREPPRFD